MTFQASPEFKKRYRKLSAMLRKKVDDRLMLFAADPFTPILFNHKLHGEHAGKRSINVTGDYRVIYAQLTDDHVVLLTVGTHAQLYGT